VDGHPVRSTPLEIPVLCGSTAASQCFASGDGWKDCVPTKKRLTFSVQVCDLNGDMNTRADDADNFMVILTSMQGIRRQLRGAFRGGGKQDYAYELMGAGEYTLSVSLRGVHIRGSPRRVLGRDYARPSSALRAHETSAGEVRSARTLSARAAADLHTRPSNEWWDRLGSSPAEQRAASARAWTASGMRKLKFSSGVAPSAAASVDPERLGDAWLQSQMAMAGLLPPPPRPADRTARRRAPMKSVPSGTQSTPNIRVQRVG